MKTKLQNLNACKQALDWVADKSVHDAWNTCERGDWMLWLLGKTRGRVCTRFQFLLQEYGKKSAYLSKGAKDADGNMKKLTVAQVSLELADFVRTHFSAKEVEDFDVDQIFYNVGILVPAIEKYLQPNDVTFKFNAVNYVQPESASSLISAKDAHDQVGNKFPCVVRRNKRVGFKTVWLDDTFHKDASSFN